MNSYTHLFTSMSTITLIYLFQIWKKWFLQPFNSCTLSSIYWGETVFHLSKWRLWANVVFVLGRKGNTFHFNQLDTQGEKKCKCNLPQAFLALNWGFCFLFFRLKAIKFYCSYKTKTEKISSKCKSSLSVRSSCRQFKLFPMQVVATSYLQVWQIFRYDQLKIFEQLLMFQKTSVQNKFSNILLI